MVSDESVMLSLVPGVKCSVLRFLFSVFKHFIAGSPGSAVTDMKVFTLVLALLLLNECDKIHIFVYFLTIMASFSICF